MNSKERLFLTLKGEKADRLPNLNILMQFAAREICVPYSSFCTDYKTLARGNIACAQKYGIDCVTTMSDPMREACDLGMEVVFPDDDVPYAKKRLIQEKADFLKLKPLPVEEGSRKYETVAAIELYKKELKDEIAVIGWVEGCFAQAADIRGVNEFLMDLCDDDNESFIRELLDFCLEQEILYAREQAKAGADIIGLGDAITSVAGPKIYRSLAREYQIKLLGALKEMGVKTKLHICGNTAPFLDALPVELIDILDIDWMVDLTTAALFLKDRVCISGNYDPVAILLQGSCDDIDNAVRACALTHGVKYCSAAGCEVPKFTPAENLMQVHKSLIELQ